MSILNGITLSWPTITRQIQGLISMHTDFCAAKCFFEKKELHRLKGLLYTQAFLLSQASYTFHVLLLKSSQTRIKI